MKHVAKGKSVTSKICKIIWSDLFSIKIWSSVFPINMKKLNIIILVTKLNLRQPEDFTKFINILKKTTKIFLSLFNYIRVLDFITIALMLNYMIKLQITLLKFRHFLNPQR